LSTVGDDEIRARVAVEVVDRDRPGFGADCQVLWPAEGTGAVAEQNRDAALPLVGHSEIGKDVAVELAERH